MSWLWIGLAWAIGTGMGPVAMAAEPAPEAAPAASIATYHLDPETSRLMVVVYNDTRTMASGFAHDHAIQAMDFDGTVTWSQGDLSRCQVDIGLAVSALWVDPPGARDIARIDPDNTVGDSAKHTIVSNIESKAQLWASKFPRIQYRSTGCEAQGDAVAVSGDLTIRGVTKHITVPMHVSVHDGTFHAQGSFASKETDFGFDPFSNLMGAIRYQDEMKFIIDVKGKAVADPAEASAD